MARKPEIKPTVKIDVKCRNGCTHKEGTFKISYPKGEKPGNYYYCESCKRYGLDRKGSLEVEDYQNSKSYQLFRPWVALEGDELERAKEECAHISQIKDRNWDNSIYYKKNID